MLVEPPPTRLPERNNLTTTLTGYWPVLTLFLLSSLVLFWKLGQNTLYDWDEAEYGQIAREMILSGDWLTPSFNYEPKFHQPPLYVWITAIFFRLLGEGEFSARLASVLSGIGLVVLTYLIGTKTHGKLVGFLSGLVLLSSYGFVDNARFATTDVMLSFFTYLAFYAFLHIDSQHEQWWYVVWIAFALALLTKSAGGLIAPIVIGPMVLINGKLVATLRSSSFWRGALIALVIAVPWPLVMYINHGQAYVSEFFGYHVLARTTEALEGNPSSNWYYLDEIQYRFFPWLYLIPVALLMSVWEVGKGQRRSLLPLLACLLVSGLFATVSTKLYWYIIPIYPALAILIAAVLAQAMRSSKLLAFVCLAIAILAVAKNYFDNQLAISLQMYGLVIGIYCIALIVRKSLSVPITALSTALLVMVALMNSSALYDVQEFEEAYLAKTAVKQGPGDREYLILYSGIDYPAPVYYSGRLVKVPRTYKELLELTKDEQHKHIILSKEDMKQLGQSHQINIVEQTERLVYAIIRYTGANRPSSAR